MASATTKEIVSSGAYASTADFERIFTEDMGGLYLLSLLLTGDPERAEECFVAGVGESTKGEACIQGVGALLGATHCHSECDPTCCAAAAFREGDAKSRFASRLELRAFGRRGGGWCDPRARTT